MMGPFEGDFRNNKDGRSIPGLYIHVPFCIKKCDYCGFFSVTDLTLLPDFLSALRVEANRYRERWKEFDTVYIGGGTPSVLTSADFGCLLDHVRTVFKITADAEITVEANPGDIDALFLAEIRNRGVNRINIGCQSFDDATLALLGRRHTAGQAAEAVYLAREAGFDNIGIDLIYGLPVRPGESASDPPEPVPGSSEMEHAFEIWLATLDKAIAFRPEHLSCYQLTAESGTSMAERIAGGSLILPGEELQARYFFATAGALENAGYLHYEVSNFARGELFRSRHNSKYWDHTPYLGLGPAAHSFDGKRRWWNSRSVDTYVRELAEGTLPVAAEESLTADQLRLEALFLGFRTSRGIHLESYQKRHRVDLLSEKRKVIQSLTDEGLVEIRDGFLRPTKAGMAVADSLALI